MKELLQKINENEWLLPKTAREGMLVDAKIIADKQILDSMEDTAIEQLTNVAMLPGVIDPVIAMPDAHFGYGLPMGAVGAFRLDDGVISSGCTGFDINCLSGDTMVLHEFGYSKPIKDFETSWTKDSIKCLNPTEKVKTTGIGRFFKFKPRSKVYQVSTLSGKKIIATEDHPFFTRKGMVELKYLTKEEISTFPFEGVKYESPSDSIIVQENGIKDEVIKRELKARGLLPLRYSNEKLPYLIKMLGFIWGDGCAYQTGGRSFVCAYSKYKEELEKLADDIGKLGYKTYIFSRRRHHKVDTFYGQVIFDATGHELRNSSHSLFLILKELGLPINDKTDSKFEVPAWLSKAPLWQKRLFLAALFGAELSSPKTVTKHGYNFYGPVFSLNKSERLIKNGGRFLQQIQAMLREFGIASKILNKRRDYIGKKGLKYRLRLQISSKPDNLIKLWKTIGYEYSKQRSFLANVAISYLNAKQQIVHERKEAIKKARALIKKGCRPINIYKQLQSPYVNKRFLQRTLYERRKEEPRISFSYYKFSDFIKIYTKDLGQTGQVWDKITEKKEIPFNDCVYDFTVKDDNHNFIANNFVVSNCGINMIRTNLKAEEVKSKLKELTEELFKAVPCGVGSKGKLRLKKDEMEKVLVDGAKWAVEQGYGTDKDLEHTEEQGRMEGADPSKVSEMARKRGLAQLGTLGAGNHFLEVQEVTDIFDRTFAKLWGLEKGQVTIMLHCGSRGLGHQVATDYLQVHSKAAEKYGIKLPDPQLACAPYNSPEGQDYYKAMKCAVNYSFANRQVMTQWIREAFSKVFGRTWQELGMEMVYALAHNIAKVEKHTVDGKLQEILVHRKGATRSFPDLPVLIAGSMGTASYILKGTDKAMQIAFGSTCHGAGRAMSRNAAIKKFRGQQIQKQLESRGEIIRSTGYEVLAEEAPEAYKDIEGVIDSVHSAGISLKVARMRPLGVVKG